MSLLEKLKNIRIKKSESKSDYQPTNKKSKPNKNSQLLKSLLENIFIASLSAIFLTSLVISAPMVEKVLPMIQYNFNTTSSEKRQTYKLTTNQSDLEIIKKDLELIKSKLSALGYKNVEISEINEIKNDGEIAEDTEKFELSISVQSLYDLSYASRAILDKSEFKIMLPKEGIDPSNEEDQLNGILPENYSDTDFGRSSFRNIDIKELKDSSGSYSYFIVPKAFPKDALKLNDFLTSNNGKYIGINLGEYVMPKLIQGEQANSLFIYISQDEKEADFYRTMFNSEKVNSEFKLAETIDEKPFAYEINIYYIFGSIILIGAMFSLLKFFLSRQNKRLTLQFFLTYFLTIALFSSYAKVTDMQFVLWTLPLATLVFGIVIYINRYMFTFGVLIVLAIFGYFIIGLENSFILQSAYLVLAGLFTNYLLEIYINKLKLLLIK